MEFLSVFISTGYRSTNESNKFHYHFTEKCNLKNPSQKMLVKFSI